MVLLSQTTAGANEVLQPAETKIIEKQHPRTGRKYYSIVSEDPAQLTGLDKVETKKYARPDYRLLDHKVKEKIAYDGPYSSRKKVYVFAGTVATLGVVGGSLGMMSAAGATAGTGASTGGAGAFLGAGTAVGAGTFGTAWIKSQPDPEKDNFERTSEARRIETTYEVAKSQDEFIQ